MSTTTLLELRDLKTWFPLRKGILRSRRAGEVRALDGVSLSVREGEIVGLVGESGCGKSTLARTILQLVLPTGGTVTFDSVDMGRLSPAGLRALRPDIQMIFQDPYSSLNPRMTVGETIREALQVRVDDRKTVAARSAELLRKVGLDPGSVGKYPHEFSGGQRQRVAIARALATKPRLVIADEPVSALDVSIQAQILNLIWSLRNTMGLTLLFISHDLSVVYHISDRIAVMYLGQIVEMGTAEAVYRTPIHPYARLLISALPGSMGEDKADNLVPKGEPPSPSVPPAGCAFHPRCPFAEASCARTRPVLEPVGSDSNRTVACLRIARGDNLQQPTVRIDT